MKHPQTIVTHPTEGETYALDRDVVDLEPLVRDAVLLSLPLAPLCANDCQGPAPEAFPAIVEDDVAVVSPQPGSLRADADADAADLEEEPRRDPRWAALDQLRLDE